MKHFFLQPMLMFLWVLVSCSGSNQKETKNIVQASDTAAVEVSVQFNNAQQTELFKAYEKLKNDLVKSDFEAGKASARVLASVLKDCKDCQTTTATAAKIALVKDIKEQRKSFTSLSNDLITLFKHANLKSGTIYVQHCPMANKGEGGDWLSSEKKIQNPYYGDEMMECGAVIEEIK